MKGLGQSLSPIKVDINTAGKKKYLHSTWYRVAQKTHSFEYSRYSSFSIHLFSSRVNKALFAFYCSTFSRTGCPPQKYLFAYRDSFTTESPQGKQICTGRLNISPRSPIW